MTRFVFATPVTGTRHVDYGIIDSKSWPRRAAREYDVNFKRTPSPHSILLEEAAAAVHINTPHLGAARRCHYALRRRHAAFRA